jgi:hypothetical protein
MAKENIGFETTVRVARDQEGRAHFAAGGFSVRGQLLNAAIPALWVLVVVVVAAVLVIKWN